VDEALTVGKPIWHHLFTLSSQGKSLFYDLSTLPFTGQPEMATPILRNHLPLTLNR